MFTCIPWGKKAKAKAKEDFLDRALTRPLFGDNTCVVCSEAIHPIWKPPCSTHKACKSCWEKYVVTESEVCGICVHVAEKGEGGGGS